MTRAQIKVIGAGIAGLATAWALIRRGASVRIIEARAVASGASGGTVGALAPHSPERWNAKKQAQLGSLMAQAAFWDEVAQVSGRNPLYARTGRVQPVGEGGLDLARARIEGAARHWPEGRSMWLTRTPDGLSADSPSGWYLCDDLTARLAPRAAMAALAAAIVAKGGQIETGQSVEDISAPAIWACGAAGLDRLTAELGYEVGRGIKGQSALLSHACGSAPQVFAGGLHIVPHGDGTVAVGSTSERDYVDARGTDEGLEAIIARARDICPELADAPVIDRWAGLRPRARSRGPLIGPWPGRAGHIVVNGGFKIGFGMAPLMGELAADLILTGRADLPEGFGF
ncbi:MAG: FAD-dependent oxidoreductase [Paracoccus sp. (in: a-proteobacteria)]|nr:FAD-dependent oxidoreductase [Paracoccus sp. (in: a-proteobacteria)]